jgi:multidrug efflux pump subunit AcrA (membrane-fusion protein)
MFHMSAQTIDARAEFELIREPLPAPLSRLGILCGCAVFLSVGLTQLLAGARELHWTGNLMTRVEVVMSPYDSRIVAFSVSPGDTIAQGETIAQLDGSSLERELQVHRKEVRRLELELAKAEAQAEVELSWRMKSLDADIHTTRLKSAELLKEKFASQVTDLAWSDFLSNNSFGLANSSASFPLLSEFPLSMESRIRAVLQQEAAHNATETFSTQIELCDSQLERLERLKGNLPDQIRKSVGLPMLREQLAEAQGEAERLEARLEAVKITSSVHGTAGVFRKQPGDDVAQGEPIVQILDRARQYVSFRVPTRELPHFETGMQLMVIFPGFEPRAGRLQPIPPQSADPSERGETMIDLNVAPVGKPWPEVPFGSTVDIALPL